MKAGKPLPDDGLYQIKYAVFLNCVKIIEYENQMIFIIIVHENV